MNLNYLKQTDNQVFNIVQSELLRQRNTLELIASENFTSKSTLEAVGSVLTNKYAEGYPGKRYYGGCDVVDEIENLAKDRLIKLFNCEYANVQPHSGSQANMGVFLTFLNHNDIVLGLDLSHGGHLTHGSPVNFSGKLYNFYSYGVSLETGRIDFDDVYKIAKTINPKLIICGGSAYPRFIEFSKFKEIAESVNAYLLADIAHPSGLIASGHHPSPFPYCDVVTSTTHKTLRGPRGGIILLGKDFNNTWDVKAPKSGRIKKVSELIDSAIMPGIQGGPLMHVIAGKAVAFKEAFSPKFKDYCKKIINNAKAFEEEFLSLGYDLVSGGTDTHLLLIDLTKNNISGKKVENALELVGITTNKNMVPFDKRSPMITSGIRIGTPSLTTRGMSEYEMKIIAKLIDKIINNINDENIFKKVKHKVGELCNDFPLYID